MSKNQALKIIYLKHHEYYDETSKIIMDKKPNEIHENLNHTKNNHTIHC